MKKNAAPEMSEKNKQPVKPETSNGFAIPQENYKFLVIGIIIIIIGFILMIGGKANSIEEFNPAVFSKQRIVVAPMIVLFGFIFEIWAIMRTPKENKDITGA